MHGELEAPSLDGRYARVCPVHKRILDDLDCPAGHAIGEGQWDTFDRVKRVYLHLGIEVDKAEVVEPPPQRLAGPGRPMALARRQTEAPTNGGSRMAKGAPGKRIIDVRRFEDAKKSVLFLHLKEVSPKDPRSTLDRYRVTWRLSGEKKGTAIATTAADEEKGRAAFAAAVKDALKEGWIETAASRGFGRAIICRPIPPAAKRPGRPPSK